MIKGGVRRKRPPHEKEHTVLNYALSVLQTEKVALLIILFGGRYFCRWFAWSLTLIAALLIKRFGETIWGRVTLTGCKNGEWAYLYPLK